MNFQKFAQLCHTEFWMRLERLRALCLDEKDLKLRIYCDRHTTVERGLGPGLRQGLEMGESGTEYTYLGNRICLMVLIVMLRLQCLCCNPQLGQCAEIH